MTFLESLITSGRIVDLMLVFIVLGTPALGVLRRARGGAPPIRTIER
jgi:hypothetical protein